MRQDAYMRAYELVVHVQSGVPGAGAAIDRLRDDATASDWPEVVRIALFAAAVAAGRSNHLQRRAAVARLLSQSEQDGAPVMVALALAMRACLDPATGRPDPAMTSGDEDLARATVILESADGTLIERISAHNACAQAFGIRWLWELCDQQYATALSLAPDPPAPWARYVLPAIAYNRAEIQVNWACVHRQAGEQDLLVERWRTWQTVLSSTASEGMPHAWTVELDALGLVLGALVGENVSDRASDMLPVVVPEEHPGAWPIGWLHLALALSEQRAGRFDRAREAAEMAVAEIDPTGSAEPYDLALFIAAELESGARPTAAMRYARRQLSLRWSHQLALHSSTLGRIQAERLRREHDVITQQAHRDDLTALLNRRGLARYVESLHRQEVASVSLLVLDLDNFKSVNDRYGHQIGDAALVSVGHLLCAHVRQSDCAVRLGGDEFALVLASAGNDVARRRAEALVDAVRAQPWDDLCAGLAMTVSVGLASGRTAEFTSLIERADRALYKAKRSGRDTVVCDFGDRVAI